MGKKSKHNTPFHSTFHCSSKPDPLRQLIQCFQRAATSEESQAQPIHDDALYIRFADVMAQSIHIEEEDGDDGDEGEIDQAVATTFCYAY
jgi:hypothetical protein